MLPTMRIAGKVTTSQIASEAGIVPEV